VEDRRTLLVRITGRDQPGLTAGLMAVLAAARAEVLDLEQVVVRDRLTLGVLVAVDDPAVVRKDLVFVAWERDLAIEFEEVEPGPAATAVARHAVTVIGQVLTPAALGGIAQAIATAGGNIDRIVRLAAYPVVSYELLVSGGDVESMRAGLVEASQLHGIDVALQREGLERRAKRLVVIDVDSTLIQDEVIELLGDAAGVGEQVRAITDRAMAGELDFEAALRERVALLAGLDESVVDGIRDAIRLTPGARTLVRTLRRLGYRLAIVSGGFTVVTDRLREDLGIDHAYANELEIVDGRVTGRIVGPIVDRARKAAILQQVAAIEGVMLEQTVAIGDGANDLDMLAIAGLGIAFNAKPMVRELADTTVSVPFLDAVLFVLGIRRDEVELADAADAERLVVR